MEVLLPYLFRVPAIFIAITIHEFTRALVSTLLGDKLPKKEGRLTLNPIKHFEPIGFIFILAANFGWGKPVNTSPLYYKNRKRDILIAAILPSVANIFFVLVINYCFKYIPAFNNEYVMMFVMYTVEINLFLAAYNILPVSPFDGAKILSALLPSDKYFNFLQYEKVILMVLLLLVFSGFIGVVFNPIVNLLFEIIKFLTI